MLNVVDILGVRVQSGALPDVVDHIDRRVETQDPTRIAFLNAHLSNVASTDSRLRLSLKDFLVLNDGVGVDLARRVLYGRAFVENLNGTDFVTAYLDRTSHKLRIYMLGARPDVIADAAAAVARRWPRHDVVGFHHGYLDQSETGGLKARIVASKPDLILVGMGNPRQERWIGTFVPEVCPCAMAVGAWFDFIAGAVPRAPSWIRRARLEWVYRLCKEPRRLAGRYLIGNFVFLTRLGFAWFRGRRGTLQEG